MNDSRELEINSQSAASSMGEKRSRTFDAAVCNYNHKSLSTAP